MAFRRGRGRFSRGRRGGRRRFGGRRSFRKRRRGGAGRMRVGFRM
jgi:hypothetical protein